MDFTGSGVMNRIRIGSHTVSDARKIASRMHWHLDQACQRARLARTRLTDASNSAREGVLYPSHGEASGLSGSMSVAGGDVHGATG